MKKYPAIKFILITVVSGICGAVLCFLFCSLFNKRL